MRRRDRPGKRFVDLNDAEKGQRISAVTVHFNVGLPLVGMPYSE
jgi:hypothetical protein